MIIVIGGEKGGTGKTTLVTNLVAHHVNQGKDPLLVDTDKQGSASAWTATRDTGSLKRVPSVQKFGSALRNELLELAKRYDDIFVDAGGRDHPELRAAILAAHRIYIPLRPGQFDVWTVPRMSELIEESRLYNPALEAYFVINAASTNPKVKDAEETMEILQDIEGIQICRTVIRKRRSFEKAPVNGMAVTELEAPNRDEKAIQELTDFYQEIFDHHE
jgi:chromosome partitioning protein